MTFIETSVEDMADRRDIALEEAYLACTDGTITSPNSLQRALFPRLSSQDTGLLLETGPCAGRLEAVFVPVMFGSRNGSQLQRLFVISSDEALNDDYLYRLLPYIRSLAVSREQDLTVYVESESPICRRYLPDGSFITNVSNHPLDAGVDLVVANFSRFRSLFFGAGGVHAMPGALEESGTMEIDFNLRRRDLFYFDEAQSYDREGFLGFVRLIEFLYAEDMDVVMGTTTLPEALRDDLSFFEMLDLDELSYQPPRTFRYISDAGLSFKDHAISIVKERYFQNSRFAIVFEGPESIEVCFSEISSLYPHGVYAYHSGQADSERQVVYAQLRELEKEGEGYLLVTDSLAIANADIDINSLITGLCSPEMLIRRAGRCNRRGDLKNGQIIVLGAGGYVGRHLRGTRLIGYMQAMEFASVEGAFSPEIWKEFAS
jgi:CRISPR-associated endonuclease/helicase Cas3